MGHNNSCIEDSTTLHGWGIISSGGHSMGVEDRYSSTHYGHGTIGMVEYNMHFKLSHTELFRVECLDCIRHGQLE